MRLVIVSYYWRDKLVTVCALQSRVTGETSKSLCVRYSLELRERQVNHCAFIIVSMVEQSARAPAPHLVKTDYPLPQRVGRQRGFTPLARQVETVDLLRCTEVTMMEQRDSDYWRDSCQPVREAVGAHTPHTWRRLLNESAVSEGLPLTPITRQLKTAGGWVQSTAQPHQRM